MSLFTKEILLFSVSLFVIGSAVAMDQLPEDGGFEGSRNRAIRVFLDEFNCSKLKELESEGSIEKAIYKVEKELIEEQEDLQRESSKNEIDHLRKSLQDREIAQKTAEAELQKMKQVEELRIRLQIPYIAYGHEQLYQRFVNGRLIYKPYKDSDYGKIEWRIGGDFSDSLARTFDLSRCGEVGKYLRIVTGYHKDRWQVPQEDFFKNSDTKLEIYLTPRFLVQPKCRTSLAAIHEPGTWDDYSWPEIGAVGIFWRLSSWGHGCYNYMNKLPIDQLGNNNLYGLHQYNRSAHALRSHKQEEHREWDIFNVLLNNQWKARGAECFSVVF